MIDAKELFEFVIDGAVVFDPATGQIKQVCRDIPDAYAMARIQNLDYLSVSEWLSGKGRVT